MVKLKIFRIYTAKSSVLIYAEDIQYAKTQFQERYGYWPDDMQIEEVEEWT